MEIKTSETSGIRKRKRSKYDTIMQGLKRREEVKREFQDYLNNSCDRYKEVNK